MRRLAATLLGTGIWAFHLFGYSLRGIWSDFIAVVGILALSAWLFFGPLKMSRERWYWFPAMSGAAVPILGWLAAILSPAVLGVVFWTGEILEERAIDAAVSPNGHWVASAQYRPVGSYAGGDGYLLARIRPTAFPLVEKVLGYSRVDVDESANRSAGSVEWLTNRIIKFPNSGATEEFEPFSLSLPAFIRQPVEAWRPLNREKRSNKR